MNELVIGHANFVPYQENWISYPSESLEVCKNENRCHPKQGVGLMKEADEDESVYSFITRNQ